MSEKEKQIDKTIEYLNNAINVERNSYFGKGCITMPLIEADKILDILQGYRKQSENVIGLPCKVGDTLYVDYEGAVYPVRVNAIRLDNKKYGCRICVRGTFHKYEYYSHNYIATFSLNSIGKTVFLTKEEAEAKMKGE